MWNYFLNSCIKNPFKNCTIRSLTTTKTGSIIDLINPALVIAELCNTHWLLTGDVGNNFHQHVKPQSTVNILFVFSKKVRSKCIGLRHCLTGKFYWTYGLIWLMYIIPGSEYFISCDQLHFQGSLLVKYLIGFI